MGDDLTGTMAGEPKRSSSSSTDPGLVLVYAQDRSAVPLVILLEPGSTVLGREPPPGGITLALSSVSRVHARVTRRGDRCTIHDLGSRNGILVRGNVVESAELSDGDDVRIGDAIFVFVAENARRHIDDGGADEHDHAFIACGPATRRIFDDLASIAASTIPVLVLGETGTGKELVAAATHAASRRKGELRALNCAAIPATLVESELFGVKKGAFSGADRDRPGIVRAADGGTLFLDEIGDLPLEIQPKLLRLLESNEISPVGGARTEQVDVRIVCATHQDLDALVAEKRFRADLYSRIRGYVVHLPPLRARKQDLHFLVRALLARLDRKDAGVSVAFMVALARYDFPFNVRELFSILRRAVALASKDETLDTKHLPDELLTPKKKSAERSGAGGPDRGDDTADANENTKPAVPTPDELRAALVEHGGNIAALARLFCRDRSLIHRWLRQHGLDADAYRPR